MMSLCVSGSLSTINYRELWLCQRFWILFNQVIFIEFKTISNFSLSSIIMIRFCCCLAFMGILNYSRFDQKLALVRTTFRYSNFNAVQFDSKNSGRPNTELSSSKFIHFVIIQKDHLIVLGKWVLGLLTFVVQWPRLAAYHVTIATMVEFHFSGIKQLPKGFLLTHRPFKVVFRSKEAFCRICNKFSAPSRGFLCHLYQRKAIKIISRLSNGRRNFLGMIPYAWDSSDCIRPLNISVWSACICHVSFVC